MRLVAGNRGYWGMAIYQPKREVNVGSLLRTAHILGAQFLAIIGKRYIRQASDTLNSIKHVPTFEYDSIAAFFANVPCGCRVIGVELVDGASLLDSFKHPERAVYLFGAEDHGLPGHILAKCHEVIKLRGERSLNLAIAGSIVAYHRGLA